MTFLDTNVQKDTGCDQLTWLHVKTFCVIAQNWGFQASSPVLGISLAMTKPVVGESSSG